MNNPNVSLGLLLTDKFPELCDCPGKYHYHRKIQNECPTTLPENNISRKSTDFAKKMFAYTLCFLQPLFYWVKIYRISFPIAPLLQKPNAELSGNVGSSELFFVQRRIPRGKNIPKSYTALSSWTIITLPCDTSKTCILFLKCHF